MTKCCFAYDAKYHVISLVSVPNDLMFEGFFIFVGLVRLRGCFNKDTKSLK